MPSQVVLYLGVGKLTIYILQKAPYLGWLKRWGFLSGLIDCPLCLGVWVYTILAFMTRHVWFTDELVYTPILSELITGMSASFLMYLVSEGWNSLFREIHIGE